MSDEESVEYESAEDGEESEGESQESEDSQESEESESEEEVTQVEVVKKRGSKSKKKDPNKPKKNLTAFFIYSNEHRSRVKEENPDIKFGEMARALSTEYKKLSAKEKKKYEKASAKDKERYQREMAKYTPPDDSDEEPSSRKKPKKDPNKPKRNLSAFFIYSTEVREDVRKENPELKFGEIARFISTQFKALSGDERAVYDKKAALDKERYQREMAKYNASS